MYEEVNEDEKVLEVIYVSSDTSADEHASYMASKHANWLGLAYDEPFKDELKRKYGVCAGAEQAAVGVEPRRAGIPTFIIVKNDGTQVKFDAADDVMAYKGGDMPQSWSA